MHHCVTYMYINFQQIRVNGSIKTVLTNILANNRKLHRFATINGNLKKSINSDMRHCKTYIYVNFEHTRVNRSIKTCTLNLLAKNCKLHKFASYI